MNLLRFMTPMMLGVCALFFWVATKVHTNNALYVYCQRCEGGGKIFYYWNQIVFITIYSSIAIFTSLLLMKAFPKLAIAFLVIMTITTYCIDKSVETTFALHSIHLPISMARIHDEEEVRSLMIMVQFMLSIHSSFLVHCLHINVGVPPRRVVHEIRRRREFHVSSSNTETRKLEPQANLDLRQQRMFMFLRRLVT